MLANRQLDEICGFTESDQSTDPDALASAWHCLQQGLVNGFTALDHQDIQTLLGPTQSSPMTNSGARVLGTAYELAPASAAQNNSLLCTGSQGVDLSIEWGQPTNVLGALMAAADYADRPRMATSIRCLAVGDLLSAISKAYEIQITLDEEGWCSPAQSLGLGACALAAHLLGYSFFQIRNCLEACLSNFDSKGGLSSETATPRLVGKLNEYALQCVLAVQTESDGGNTLTMPTKETRYLGNKISRYGAKDSAAQDQLRSRLYKAMLNHVSPVVCTQMKEGFANLERLKAKRVHDFMASLVSSLS
ncbi:MAG: MmgE/PrpD family protein [Pseudomonadota bacterium]